MGSSLKTGIQLCFWSVFTIASAVSGARILVFLGRTLYMRKILLAVLLLSAVAAVAATPDSSSQAVTTAPVIRHYLMPDHSIKSVFPDLLAQSETLAPRTDNFVGGGGGPKRTGFCRCSCGFQCTSSADCQGVSCDPFITCCVHKSQNPEVGWFTRSFESSSHQTALPDPILKEVLKAECR